MPNATLKASQTRPITLIPTAPTSRDEPRIVVRNGISGNDRKCQLTRNPGKCAMPCATIRTAITMGMMTFSAGSRQQATDSGAQAGRNCDRDEHEYPDSAAKHVVILEQLAPRLAEQKMTGQKFKPQRQCHQEGSNDPRVTA